jgi:Na+-driven multidrug efflux pump
MHGAYAEETPKTNYGTVKVHVDSIESDRATFTNDTNLTPTQVFWKEARSLLHIAIPTIIILQGSTIPPFLTASYVGRAFGPAYLDGFQLASLTGNLFTLSLLQGLYSASDTLSPQACTAGNYSELGYIAMRGFISSMAVVLPICVPLVFCIRKLLIKVGEDPEASLHAGTWYAVYVLSLPIYVVYMVTVSAHTLSFCRLALFCIVSLYSRL